MPIRKKFGDALFRGVGIDFFTRSGVKQRAKLILARADKARDQGEWSEAADLFSQFLELKPDRADIWIQLGNMEKEHGRLSQARAAYEKALELEPRNADAHLMLGHFYKVAGDFEKSEDSYRQAFLIDNSMGNAYRELRALGGQAPSEGDASSPISGERERWTLFDLSDIFKFLEDNMTVSGIQRVQLCMVECILKLDRPELKCSFFDESIRSYLTVKSEAIEKLVAALSRQHVDHGELKSIIASAKNSAEVYLPMTGDVIFVAGAFWMIPDIITVFNALKKRGVRIGVYIYDIIPVTHPEFCAPELVATFSRSLFHFIKMSDFMLAISDYSAEAARKYFKDQGQLDLPVETVRLAHQLKSGEGAASKAAPQVRELLGKPFVLFVSTIEARKNHAYLVEVWRRLLEKYPAHEVPELVFVGRKGWRVDDFMKAVESRNHLDGKLHILRNVSDADLALLYKAAKFTSFPSFVEGWGLPIGESLAFGKLCVASGVTSMPEVGGDLVQYIDPYNVSEGFDLIEKLIFTPAVLKELEKRIADEFRPVSWESVAGELVARIDAFSKVDASETEEKRSYSPHLPLGSVFQFEYSRRDAAPKRVMALSDVDFAFDEQWMEDSDQVKWLAGRRGVLDFHVARASELSLTSALVMMRLTFEDNANEENVVCFTANKRKLGEFTHASGGRKRDYVVTCSVPLEADGEVHLEMSIDGKLPRDSRLLPIFMGMKELGVASHEGEMVFSVFQQQVYPKMKG